MKDKLEVGMYVRTPLGIAKYLGNHEYENFITGEIIKTDMHEFDKLDEYLWSGDVSCVVFDSDLEDIVLKASYNIDEVLEVGDIAIMIAYGLPIFKQISESDLLEIKIGNYQVYKVLTKEQFESMSYKLGDNK